MFNAEKLFTKKLGTGDSPFVISADDGLERLSILPAAEAVVQVTGTRSIKGIQSSAITIPENTPLNLSFGSGFESITITIVSGTCTFVGA